MLRAVVIALAAALALPAAGAAQEAARVLPEIVVIGTTPLLGTGVPVDQVPGHPQTLSDDQLERFPALQLIDRLDRQLAGVAVVDVQNSTYQKDIRYRGFAASPLLGESQGLAVFQNGVRINEAFGDTVQWDLIPEPAIRSLNLVNNNPVFGLNALGGAISIDMHDGFSFRGIEGEAYGGYWERTGAALQAGWSSDTIAAYVAADHQNDEGWRNESPSDLARLYTDLGVRGETFQANFSFTYADTDLIGNGPAPVELLEANRRAIFTFPDITDNEIFFFQADGSVDVSDSASMQANAYFRRITRATLNGDEVEAANCDAAAVGATFAADGNLGVIGNSADVLADPGGFLCEEEDEPELLIDQFGNAIPAFAATYGAKNTTSTQTATFGGAVQGMVDHTLLGLDNVLIVGTALDFSETEFHNEQLLGSITLARGIAEGPQPFLSLQKYESDAAGGAFAPGAGTPAQIKNFTRNLGVYLVDTLAVTDDLTLTLAGRFNRTETDTTDQFVYDAARRGDLNGRHRFSRFNPAAGATYRLDGLGATAYLGFAENTRAPTPAELGCADPLAPCRFPNAFLSDPPLDQVVSRSFEAGLRGSLPDLPAGLTVNWNLGAFTTTNIDDIIFVSAGTGLGSGFFRNVGDTRRRGLELGADGRWGRLGWYANYTFLEATFQSEFTVAGANHPLGPSFGGDIPVEMGDNIPGVPEHTLNLGLDYALTDDLVLGGTMVARSGVYLRGDEGNFLDRTDGFVVFNAHASYALADRVEVFARVENLLDAEYETFGVLGETGNETPIYELPGGITNPRFLSPGQPFAAYVGVRLKLN